MAQARRCLSAWLALAGLCVALSASAVPQPQTPYAVAGSEQSFSLFRRLAFVLDGLRQTHSDDAPLREFLSRVRLQVPLQHRVPGFPNAYAIPGDDKKLIVFEADFARQISAIAGAGAYLALAAWAKDEEQARQQVCRQLEDIDRQARESRTRPVFGIDVRRFSQAGVPETERALRTKQLAVVDDTLVWFLLHEAGHHVLGHRASAADSPGDRRKREAQADRFASRKMLALGFGLHGVERFLAGWATVETCLGDLGYVYDEASSSHPSWRSRHLSIQGGFDTSGSGDGYPRQLFAPMSVGDIRLFVAKPGLDAETRMFLGTVGSFAVSQWKGNSVAVFVREAHDGGRLEITVPDTTAAVCNLTLSIYDSANRRTGHFVDVPAVQLSPKFLGWVELAPGVRAADTQGKSLLELSKQTLMAAGTPDDDMAAVMASTSALLSARTEALRAYSKGLATWAEMSSTLEPAIDRHAAMLRRHLGSEARARLSRYFAEYPMRGWESAPQTGAYDELMRTLAERNWDWLPQ